MLTSPAGCALQHRRSFSEPQGPAAGASFAELLGRHFESLRESLRAAHEKEVERLNTEVLSLRQELAATGRRRLSADFALNGSNNVIQRLPSVGRKSMPETMSLRPSAAPLGTSTGLDVGLTSERRPSQTRRSMLEPDSVGTNSETLPCSVPGAGDFCGDGQALQAPSGKAPSLVVSGNSPKKQSKVLFAGSFNIDEDIEEASAKSRPNASNGRIPVSALASAQK